MAVPLDALISRYEAAAAAERRDQSLHWLKMADLWRDADIARDLPTFRNSSQRWLARGLDKTRDDETTRELARTVEGFVGTDHLSLLTETMVGKPITTSYSRSDGTKLAVNFNDLQLTLMASRIFRLWTATESGVPTNVLEIGGGYGGLAAKLLRLWPECRYTLVDLPEASLLQQYYLQDATDARIVLDVSPPIENTGTGVVTLVGARDCHLLNLAQWDLVINTRSMQEMDAATIDSYFDRIHRDLRSGGLFYNLNRFMTGSTGLPNCIARYPYDRYWQLISAVPFPTQWVQLELVTQRTTQANPTCQRFIRALPKNFFWHTGIGVFARHPLQALDQLMATLAPQPWASIKRVPQQIRLKVVRRKGRLRLSPSSS